MPEDIQLLLGRMDAKLDELMRRSAEDRKTIERLQDRVTQLEAFRWKLLGAASVLGGIGGLMTKALA